MERNDTDVGTWIFGERGEKPGIVIAIEIIILIILFILSILGNILVCLVIYRSRRIQSTTNFFVFALAVVDLVYTITSTPFLFGRVIGNNWMFGSAVCKSVHFVQATSTGIVMYLMSSIAIDRYYTIIYPLSFKVTRGTAKRMITVTLLVGFFSSVPLLYFYETVDVLVADNKTKCTCPVFPNSQEPGKVVSTLSLQVLHVFAPLLVLITLYARIINFVWKIQFRYFLIQRTINQVPKAKVKMVKMLIIVTIGTVLCFLPFSVVSVWACLVRPLYMYPGDDVSTVFLWMLVSATVFKPVVYTCLNSNFRQGSKEVFCMSSSRCYRSNTYAITNASTFGKKNHIGVMVENSHKIIESPSKVFDRSLQNEKTFWPLPSDGIPTTCV